MDSKRIKMEILSLFIGFMFIFGWTWLAKTDEVDYVDDSHINLLQTRKVDTDGETPMVGTFQEDKGADVIAATNMTLGIDGNYYVITGNTAIVSIIHAQAQPGTVIRLKFSGTPIVTHHATNLILPGGANLTMAAGNVMELVNIDTSKWRCTNILKADGAPLDHAASHENGGGDEIDVVGLSGLLADGQHVLDAEVKLIKLDDFATPDDNTDLNSTTTYHGLLKKLSNVASQALNGVGNWVAFLQNMIEDPSPELGGELDAGAHTIGFTQQTATGDGTTTIDWKLGNKFFFTHGAMGETFTFTAPSNPCNLLLKIKQDAGAGGRDCTWPGSVTWLGDEPIWTDGATSKVIIVSFYYDGTTYWGQATPWEA